VITLHHRPKALAESLVLPLALDVLSDRLAYGVRNANPLRPRDSLQLVRLLDRQS
jgi:hypothetical protein